MSHSVRNIAVIQTAFLGDIVLTTPFLKALQKTYQGSEIYFITTKAGAHVVEGLERVHPIVFQKRSLGFFAAIKDVTDQIPKDLDMVFCVHRSPRSLYLAARLQGKKTVAFESILARVLGFQTVKYPDYNENTHYAQKPLHLLSGQDTTSNVTPSDLRPWLRATDAALIKFGLEKKSYLALSPFSVWGTKMWFAQRFTELAIEIAKKKDLKVVLIGSASSRESVVAESMESKIKEAGVSPAQIKNLIGLTSVSELKTVVANAEALIANDSAPVHIAAAFNVPTVAIFGPTVKKWGFFPLSENSEVVERSDVECRPCSKHGPEKCPKGHFHCMDKISVADVYRAVDRVVEKAKT